VFLGCVLAALAVIALVVIADVIAVKIGRAKVDAAPDGVTGGHAVNLIRALFLMSFAIGLIVPWSTNDSARQNTYAEAQALIEAYWQADRLPAAEAMTVHDDLRGYTHFVIDDEWPVLASGELSQRGWTMLDGLRANLMSLNYQEKSYEDADTAVLAQISDVYAARRQRAVDAAASLPEAVSLFAILTGLLVVLFPFMVGVRPRGRALVPLIITAGLIGSGLFLVVDNNHVFSGGIAVKPDAFQSALLEMQRIS
jgi:hypothetical protein